MKNALVLSLVLAMPTAAAAQSEGFVIRLGTDTIAIENFVRSAPSQKVGPTPVTPTNVRS